MNDNNIIERRQTKHAYMEYHDKDVDGFLVKCDTADCPSPATVILGMKMLCENCGKREGNAHEQAMVARFKALKDL
jgi:hypothetical protein